MKIFIFGSGQLGKVLQQDLPSGRTDTGLEIQAGPDKHIVSVWNSQKRIEKSWLFDAGELPPQELLEADVVINTIAMTLTKECEKNYYLSNIINAEFPILLAKWMAANSSALFVPISTGCIFDGNTTPHFEDSAPTPLINYSLQKFKAEAVEYIYNKTLIIRPRMTFSNFFVSSNIIEKVRYFNELIDEPNSMTCAYDISRFINVAIENNLTGTFNFCNKGMISPKGIRDILDCNKHYQTRELFVSRKDVGDYEDITKEELFAKTGMKLTNTWIESRHLSDWYDIPEVETRIRQMIGMRIG